MSAIKMLKKSNSNLLKPETAVEDFLDTLLQESTEQPVTEKTFSLKSKLLLMPDLEVKPLTPEAPQKQLIAQHEREAIDTDGPPPQISDASAGPVNNYHYEFPLQCLMFSVAGNQLSIPLINMGSVLAWGDRLTQLPDSPDWFLGILQHRDLKVKVADTAKVLQIRKDQRQYMEPQHLLVFGDDNWAISCDKLGDVIKLAKDDVKWSKQGGKSLSLGTIRQSLAILLDPAKIINQLNEHN